MTSIYDSTVRMNGGDDVSLADYRGKVMLIVNTASNCGFTPQYAGLDMLYRDLQDRGFVVLAFPCNQFGAQEPGDATEIASFCSLTYDVSFPLFEKIEVNGSDAHPLYEWLKAQAPGLFGSQSIKWNFTKFLVGRDGSVAGRSPPPNRKRCAATSRRLSKRSQKTQNPSFNARPGQADFRHSCSCLAALEFCGTPSSPSRR